MAPEVGLEPTTVRLTAECSTIELLRKMSVYYIKMITRIINSIKEKIKGKPLSLRSPHWDTVRKHHVKNNPTCAACGGNQKLQVHHKQPFHLCPELELEPKNLITLCEFGDIDCHFNIGHHRNWKSFNPNVEKDAAEKLKNKIN